MLLTEICDLKKDYNKSLSEVMTSGNLVTVSKGTSLQEAEIILQKNKIEKLPVVSNDNTLLGLITFRDITKVTQKNQFANKDQFGRLRVAAAIGVYRRCNRKNRSPSEKLK